MTPLAAIAALLRDRIGFDAATVGAPTLGHAVRGRIRARGVDGTAAYLAALTDDTAEWQALIEAVVVPETWFFRDQQPFALLGRWVARRWSARDAHNPVAVLSLPCASGEEAWSIAIALAAAGLPPQAFRIDAIDLSERALSLARAGLYAARALRGQPLDPAWAAYLHRRSDGRLEVARELRGAVHFARGNLVEIPGTLGGRRFDCIFSRNLLIYCAAAARGAALAGFAELLHPDGLLVLGHAETLPPGTHGFVREGPPGAFAWRRGGAKKATPRTTSPPATGSRPLIKRSLPPAPATRSLPPAPATRSLPPLRGKVRMGGKDLAQARQLADAGKLTEAAALAAARVAAAPTDAAAHALLGIVLAAQGHDERAVEHLRRALYLAPAHEEALVHLALLLERRGDRAAATRLRHRARRSEEAR